MTNRAWRPRIFISTIAAAGLVWSVSGAAEPSKRERIAVGRNMYAQHCASCHGDDLQGQPNWRKRLSSGKLRAPPHDETGHTWHHPDWQLFEMTKSGRNPIAVANRKTDMPAFAAVLTDEEIWAVLEFIKSRWPEKIRSRQAEFTRKLKQ